MDPLLIGLLLAGGLVVVGLLVRAAALRSTGAETAVRITPHAADRMAERRVGEREIRQAVARPDRVVATTYTDLGGGAEERDSVRLEKDFRGRALKVWVPVDWRTVTPVAVKSVAWQYVEAFAVRRTRVGAVIGRGGQTIRNLEDGYDVRITIDGRTGAVRVLGDDATAVRRARRRIRSLAG